MKDGPPCLGIALDAQSMCITTLYRHQLATLVLPFDNQGILQLKALLDSLQAPARLAISGAAALSLALALSQAPVSDVFILSTTVAEKAPALAQYASRAI